MGFEPMLAMTAKHIRGPFTTDPRDSVQCECVLWFGVCVGAGLHALAGVYGGLDCVLEYDFVLGQECVLGGE